MKPQYLEQPAEQTYVPQFYSKDNFLIRTLEPEHGRDKFDIFEKRLVRIEVDGFVWIKRGTAIAYHGDLKFHRELVLDTSHLKQVPGREIVPLVKAEGKGCLYISDDGKHNQVVRLDGGSVFVASSNLLAFEPALKHDVHMVGGVGLLAGGIFVVRLSGHGLVAISVMGEPLTMRVTPEDPVSTDPTATVAWTGDLWPELKTDLETRSILAHGGGEPVQMLFRGDGYVAVHARSRFEAMRAGILKRILSKIKGLIG